MQCPGAPPVSYTHLDVYKRQALNSKFGYKSVMQIPKLDKVVINVACGEAKDNEKILEAVMKDLGPVSYTHLDVYKRQPHE